MKTIERSIATLLDHTQCDIDHDDNGAWFCYEHEVDICFSCKLEIIKGSFQCGKHIEPDYDYDSEIEEQKTALGSP